MKALYRGGEGEKGPLCDPGSELLLGGREGDELCEDDKWDGKTKKNGSSAC